MLKTSAAHHRKKKKKREENLFLLLPERWRRSLSRGPPLLRGSAGGPEAELFFRVAPYLKVVLLSGTLMVEMFVSRPI